MTALTPKQRRGYIGSSESPILLGISPYGTKFGLYHEKAGNIPPEDRDQLERVQAGKYLEPAIAQWAGHKWSDWVLSKARGYLKHPQASGFGCSIDFEDITDPNGAPPPVEIKNADGLIFRQQWAVEGGELVDAPLHYLVQLQHQLACRPKCDHGWLVVCAGGNSLFRMRVSRHPGVIQRIEKEVKAFWESIAEKHEPSPDFEVDGATIAQLYSNGTGEHLDLSADNRLPELCASYLSFKDDEKKAKRYSEAALAEIKQKLGNASGATCSGYRVKVADIGESRVPEHTRKGYRRWYVKELTDLEKELRS